MSSQLTFKGTKLPKNINTNSGSAVSTQIRNTSDSKILVGSSFQKHHKIS